MSAFIVSKEHIDAICTAALSAASRYGLHWTAHGDLPKVLHRGDDPSHIGQMLWHENVASVAHRYDDCAPGEWPGPTGLSVETVLSYKYRRRGLTSVVQSLKLLDCYEYQSCEHPEWETSEANVFCERLRRVLIHQLPGYEEADWGF